MEENTIVGYYAHERDFFWGQSLDRRCSWDSFVERKQGGPEMLCLLFLQEWEDRINEYWDPEQALPVFYKRNNQRSYINIWLRITLDLLTLKYPWTYSYCPCYSFLQLRCPGSGPCLFPPEMLSNLLKWGLSSWSLGLSSTCQSTSVTFKGRLL